MSPAHFWLGAAAIKSPSNQLSDPSDDNSVGYGRPQRSGQFKPGQSGNPFGRPRKADDSEHLLAVIQPILEMLRAMAKRKLVVREGGIQGMRNRQIAATVGISEGMVKLYLHKAYQKLGVGSRTELAALLRESAR